MEQHSLDESCVSLVCVKEGSRLRVRITSPGYLNTANCQFPRNIRAVGRTYSVPATGVTLAQGPGGKYFYRVNKNLVTAVVNKKPEKVFGDDDGSECLICMDQPKKLVFVPCGHYCSCSLCAAKLNQCPLCRCDIQTAIDRDLVQ